MELQRQLEVEWKIYVTAWCFADQRLLTGDNAPADNTLRGVLDNSRNSNRKKCGIFRLSFRGFFTSKVDHKKSHSEDQTRTSKKRERLRLIAKFFVIASLKRKECKR